MMIVQSPHILILGISGAMPWLCIVIVNFCFQFLRLDIIGLSALHVLLGTWTILFILRFDYTSAASSCPTFILFRSDNVYRSDSGHRDECSYFCGRGCGKLYLKSDRHFRPYPEIYKWLENLASTTLQDILLIPLLALRSFGAWYN